MPILVRRQSHDADDFTCCVSCWQHAPRRRRSASLMQGRRVRATRPRNVPATSPVPHSTGGSSHDLAMLLMVLGVRKSETHRTVLLVLAISLFLGSPFRGSVLDTIEDTAINTHITACLHPGFVANRWCLFQPAVIAKHFESTSDELVPIIPGLTWGGATRCKASYGWSCEVIEA